MRKKNEKYKRRRDECVCVCVSVTRTRSLDGFNVAASASQTLTATSCRSSQSVFIINNSPFTPVALACGRASPLRVWYLVRGFRARHEHAWRKCKVHWGPVEIRSFDEIYARVYQLLDRECSCENDEKFSIPF